MTLSEIWLTGAGSVVLGPTSAPTSDPTPFLRVKKSRKFMGLQDDLAVVAAGRALESARVDVKKGLGERAGLFLAVGYISFRAEDIGPVVEASIEEKPGVGATFDVRRFGAGGYQKAHPLLTFRCLPNMPAYHVSVCFDVQGPYFVTYPGAAQLYVALEEALAALEDGRVDLALVGGVAAQSNFLVRHQLARLEPPISEIVDVGAMFVLERADVASSRGATRRATLSSLALTYEPPDLEALVSTTADAFADYPHPDHLLVREGPGAREGFGPALLPVTLADALASRTPKHLTHELRSRDGLRATSQWIFGEGQDA